MSDRTRDIPERLARLLDTAPPNSLCGGHKGLEKESLRITEDGRIATTPHPATLGSALTHPHITTDYSEALLEFITPPYQDITDALNYLQDIQLFVYEQLDNELLLAASMPCGIDGDESIPIARYGSSNIGRMKHVYRHGLWHRYGRAMQSIAGIHFNYSVPSQIWTELHRLESCPEPAQTFIADNYFNLIRNFMRQGWIILYLFGSSPAICKRFFTSRPQLMDAFETFDDNTLFHPYATTLRMSDIGYRSNAQTNLNIDFNSLSGYIASLARATATPFPKYERIGVKVGDNYRQLSTAILQIENEFYSTVRPKQVVESGEKPTQAMQRRGVRYVEVRSLDLDLFCPIGIRQETARFIEALLLSCLFQPSPPVTADEQRGINANQLTVACQGRQPGLLLHQKNRMIPLRDWAETILADMAPICRALDNDDPARPYTRALEQQQRAVRDPDLTPSARQLQQMRAQHQSYAPFVLQVSAEHKETQRAQQLDKHRRQAFQEMTRVSLAKQKEIEDSDTLPFNEFLRNYLIRD